MIIDTAIKNFLEKYDREAMDSITNISRDLGLIHNRSTLKGFDIKESFDKFQKYLEGYASYKIENINNEKASPQNAITESVGKFINTQLFVEKDLLYTELPLFVEEYLVGVKSLIETIEDVKSTMVEADINPEDVGSINEFVDQFMMKLHESFDPAMNRILDASGYNTKKRLHSSNNKIEKPVFL